MLSDILKVLDKDGSVVRWRTELVVVEVVSNEGRLAGNRGICVVWWDSEWCKNQVLQ